MHVLIDLQFIEEKHLNELKTKCPNMTFHQDLDDCESVEAAVLMSRNIKEETLSKMPNLKFIQLMSAGFDHVNIDLVKEKKIVLANAKDVYSIQIAEHVFAMILSFTHHMFTYKEQMKDASWTRHEVSHELYGSTFGLLGAGSIATEVAKRAKAFGANVLGYRKSNVKSEHYDEIYTDQKGFEHLLKVSDYVVMTLPLNDDTRHMMNEKAFRLMKNSAFFINIARGGVVDQEALTNALINNEIAYACLDVTSPEPLPKDHPLWSLNNVIITPHASSESPYVYDRLLSLIIENLNRFKRHDDLLHVVNLD
jgi:phosphoglycerate dehydrogenase-like enzyme